MKPVFIVNGHDYTKYIAWDSGLKPSKNDIDASGSGRNLLDGTMYRSRIAVKAKYTVSFIRLTEGIMTQLEEDMYSGENYVMVTTLDARTNTEVEREYYCSTINEGVQRYIGGQTVYDGVTFDITER